MREQIVNHYIGGFFEMALPDAKVDRSLLSEWGRGAARCSGFVNARSALSALLKSLGSSRVFLPAYSCTSLMDACLGFQVIFYPINESLDPNVDFLKESVQQGDVVLAINYFGRAPSREFLDFVNEHTDITFIEDCAQSLSTGVTSWGDWRLFSPRKLVGVADGGFIVPKKTSQENINIDPISNGVEAFRWIAALSRLEDQGGAFNANWYAENQQHEQSMKVENSAISYLSYCLLSHLDVHSIIQKRKSNYKILYEALSSLAVFKEDNPVYAPFGFPIRVAGDMRDALVQALIHDNIFPAIHWRDLASPFHDFEFEHELSKEILTLPCDQRYGAKDMAYIIASVHKFLKGPS